MMPICKYFSTSALILPGIYTSPQKAFYTSPKSNTVLALPPLFSACVLPPGSAAVCLQSSCTFRNAISFSVMVCAVASTVPAGILTVSCLGLSIQIGVILYSVPSAASAFTCTFSTTLCPAGYSLSSWVVRNTLSIEGSETSYSALKSLPSTQMLSMFSITANVKPIFLPASVNLTLIVFSIHKLVFPASSDPLSYGVPTYHPLTVTPKYVGRDDFAPLYSVVPLPPLQYLGPLDSGSPQVCRELSPQLSPLPVLTVDVLPAGILLLLLLPLVMNLSGSCTNHLLAISAYFENGRNRSQRSHSCASERICATSPDNAGIIAAITWSLENLRISTRTLFNQTLTLASFESNLGVWKFNLKFFTGPLWSDSLFFFPFGSWLFVLFQQSGLIPTGNPAALGRWPAFLLAQCVHACPLRAHLGRSADATGCGLPSYCWHCW
ncbi:hypothetical protein Pelo_5794 [Pelomyxa schiedti]|nr:hypothetical protein Pelo_5794 [Pelomyxa schiedti]